MRLSKRSFEERFSRYKALIAANLDIAGYLAGGPALCGPQTAQIDIANTCNNNCIACWLRSPLLHGERESQPDMKAQLPTAVVMKLLGDLARSGTKHIYFSGGGEPFSHPDAIEIFESVKSYGMSCTVHCNFTLVTREHIDRMIEAGVECLTVSLWAGSPEIYAKTHPNKTEDDFREMTERLKYLTGNKSRRTLLNIYNVISSVNCHAVEEMVHFAADVGADRVSFALVDVIPGKTDSLRLSEAQMTDLQQQWERICQQRDRIKNETGLEINDFEAVNRRIVSSEISLGNYEKDFVEKKECYAGWVFTRINALGTVVPCLKACSIPSGDINEKSFGAIWSSKAQRLFRQKGRLLPKGDPFFRQMGSDKSAEIGCIKSCDNIPNNLEFEQRLKSLRPKERMALKIVGHYYKYTRPFRSDSMVWERWNRRP